MIEILFLGTGTSHGVPMITCKCEVCVSTNPKNKRLRTSILMRYNEKNVLVDTSTDFRRQMLDYDIDRIDAVLFTHTHADHLHGLDDIRIYSDNQDQPIDCYGSAKCLEFIWQRFNYIFTSHHIKKGIPKLELHPVSEAFDLLGETIIPIEIAHGHQMIFGYRIRDFAYLTDCSGIPDSTKEMLSGLDVMVLDALRHQPHPTHFSVSQAIEVVKELRPRRTLLTHICHQLEHEQTNRELPDGVELAYDGMVIRVPDDRTCHKNTLSKS